MSKTCDGCKSHDTHEDSFAMELLKGYKRQFYVTVAVLSTIILLLTGYIIYDAYIDSQYEVVDYSYSQDGNGNNIIGNDNEVDYNGAKTESEN